MIEGVGGYRVLFVGNDWAEDHHDVEIVDEEGRRLARRRFREGLDGVTGLHAMIAQFVSDEWGALDPADAASRVKVGIETDRGVWVQALVAAGYEVFAINPMSVARYRERHSTSGAKSDAGDAHVLAEIVRLDRAHHRPIVGDSELGEAVKLVVVKTDESLTEAQVRDYCKTNLTGYKQPKVVEFRTDLPKTPVGKILRRELRDKKQGT